MVVVAFVTEASPLVALPDLSHNANLFFGVGRYDLEIRVYTKPMRLVRPIPNPQRVRFKEPAELEARIIECWSDAKDGVDGIREFHQLVFVRRRCPVVIDVPATYRSRNAIMRTSSVLNQAENFNIYLRRAARRALACSCDRHHTARIGSDVQWIRRSGRASGDAGCISRPSVSTICPGGLAGNGFGEVLV